MDIAVAQEDMRQSYLGGGPGVLISGLVWLISGISTFYLTQNQSLLLFFFGGMFIHPLGMLVSKLFHRSGQHHKQNSLGKLALESTILIFLGLFLAYINLETNPTWFFPIMLLIIGARYLIFQSIYGMKLYWILGIILMLAGYYCLSTSQPMFIAAIAGGLIELIFSLYIILRERGKGLEKMGTN